MKGSSNYNHSNNSIKENNGGKHFLIHGNKPPSSSSSSFSPRLVIFLIIFLSSIYCFYIISLFFSPPPPCPPSTDSSNPLASSISISNSSRPPPPPSPPTSTSSDAASTNLSHIVFGMAAASNLWDKRKKYIKTWYEPRLMRGFVFLDKPVKERSPADLPRIRISGDTARFPYTHRQGHRSAIRISRIVSEAFNLNLPNVRWFVMGDDDTVFVPENLVRVLSKFDHRQMYYIGSSSESHLQNIYFSYNMAYGGGGFAISKPLAAALSGIQDGCMKRYPALYGSDDRIQACMAELGVPLTKHRGFHQYDVYGDLLGLLAAHPVTPLISLHHLDVVHPIFPAMSRADAVQKLFDGPIRIDSAGTMQQSICYESDKRWTVSISWGFVVQIIRGVMSPREMEMPVRTFLNWYKRADYTAYAFNTRPVARNPCQKPYVYYMSSSRYDDEAETSVTEYERYEEKHPACKWRMADPSKLVDRIVVYKKPDPGLWDRAPRRNCCRVVELSSEDGKKTMAIDVGLCREGEVVQS